jgi:actin-like ATPase involved in cell morphogenesis
MLRGLPQRISRELGLPVRVADDARKCVLRGVARSLG